MPSTWTPWAVIARAAAAYSTTDSGPYCQPSPQSPPSSTPPGAMALAMSLPHSSSSTSAHSASPAAPASPRWAIAMNVTAAK